jgi:transposase-like protein
MRQNATTFVWTEPRKQAVLLVAEDDLSDTEIAARVGVHRATLDRWKQHPDFAAQVAHHIEDLNRAMTRLAIAKKHKRVTELNALHEKALRVIEQRGAEYQAMAEEDAQQPTITPLRQMIGDRSVPAGGETGLLVRQLKQIGAGRTAQLVEEFAFDAALVKEIRALQEQAAKELGQWVDRSEVESTTTVVRIVGVDTDAI